MSCCSDDDVSVQPSPDGAGDAEADKGGAGAGAGGGEDPWADSDGAEDEVPSVARPMTTSCLLPSVLAGVAVTLTTMTTTTATT